uniref:Acetylcholinesterase (inferred by orthology to a zebrafish protein) n=1 Tax=Strongyloides venezuelensis TaxID=75913 RepID=A0A0K0FGP3_STRVS
MFSLYLVKYNFEHFDTYNQTNKFSKNCLSLNIWVPQNKNGPVFVVIHGGSYSGGTASLDNHNGSILTIKSRATVVNINYRLGVFGFLYLGNNSKIKGNIGFLEQQMDMKWVYENIKKFGSKKDKITLFGESAEGASVTGHFLPVASYKYFSRVVVMLANNKQCLNNSLYKNSIRKYKKKLAKFLKCRGNSEKILKCLHATNVKKLLKASVNMRNNKVAYYKRFIYPSR